MNIKRLFVLATIAASLFVHPAAADDASLFVAGIQMRLGMPREPLLTHLRSHYKLTQTDGGSYFILEKIGDGYRVVGGVSFQDDKVSWLSRDWGTFHGKNALELANELHSALQNLQEASGQAVFAYPSKTQSVPGLRITTIDFLSGARKLTLSIAEGDVTKGGQQVSLQETLDTK